MISLFPKIVQTQEKGNRIEAKKRKEARWTRRGTTTRNLWKTKTTLPTVKNPIPDPQVEWAELIEEDGEKELSDEVGRVRLSDDEKSETGTKRDKVEKREKEKNCEAKRVSEMNTTILTIETRTSGERVDQETVGTHESGDNNEEFDDRTKTIVRQESEQEKR
jgi:hypothetical protein